jgi:hypothetical protein
VVETLATLALAATLTSFGVLVAVHLRPTGYDPLRDAVSDYGVGPSLPYYRAQTAAMALAAIFVAAALAKTVDPAPKRAIVLLCMFAAARLAIPFFPTDLDRTRRTGTGVIHGLLAALAFGTVAWAAATLPDRVHWTGLAPLGWIVVATAIAMAFSLRARVAYFGLVERLFYAATLAWLAFVAVRLV